MPPLVPVIVNAGVVVAVATEMMPPVKLTLVTVPPAGVAHEPSPRQNVLAEADVPELRLVTGRFPVTPVVSGNPVALVNTPDAGVPSAGVVKTGLVSVLLVSVCVPVRVTTVPSMEIVPVEVIGPPVRPVPVAIEVTPEPDANGVQAPLR